MQQKVPWEHFMSYQKFLVDNTTCSRRFHCTFDDEEAKQSHVEVKCPHCGVAIFKADDHEPVALAREENLVKMTDLSRKVVKECRFQDPFKRPRH